MAAESLRTFDLIPPSRLNSEVPESLDRAVLELMAKRRDQRPEGAAAVGGRAVKDIIEEVVARPHTEQFADAVEAGGAILWVRCASAERERDAMAILEKSGATNVHVVDRSSNSRA